MATLLGNFSFPKKSFNNLDKVVNSVREAKKITRSEEKNHLVSAGLYALLREAEPGFWLGASIEYLEKVASEGYTFAHFELWLNEYSGISKEENRRIRALIAGKSLPREDYQRYFPIGMGKVYKGPHFVAAHASPDLDTTIASFWGWVDAFAARVSSGLHLWNIPGGPNLGIVEIPLLFQKIFGEKVFDFLARTRPILTLSAYEIMRADFELQKEDYSCQLIDHERGEKAVILVDAEGEFVGDFREIDVEEVRGLVMLLDRILSLFEKDLYLALIDENMSLVESLFSKEILSYTKGFTAKQKESISRFCTHILKIQEKATFKELSKSLQGTIDLEKSFSALEKVKSKEEAKSFLPAYAAGLEELRMFFDRLGVAIKIKKEVFGISSEGISEHAEIEEIKERMALYPYLTVLRGDGKFPIGIVRLADISTNGMGTVTLRDFSDREETGIAPFLDVISVIDHHKSSLQTRGPSVMLITDSQSANALLAELSFTLNDRYSLGGLSQKEIEDAIQSLEKEKDPLFKARMLKRLHMRLENVLKSNGRYWVSAEREFMEYLHFLHAIFDDTDLLSKVSQRDVYCIAELARRLKSLKERKEVEGISFDDIAQDENFVKQAALRLLKDPDIASLYGKVYEAKEQAIGVEIAKNSHTIFADTKEQSGCARVGQIKLFAANFKEFDAHREAIYKKWEFEASEVFKKKSFIDLHIQMVTTISKAEDILNQTIYTHQDELWFKAFGEAGMAHLRQFLRQFASFAKSLDLTVHCPVGWREFFEENFTFTYVESSEISMRFSAAKVNSRKAHISPYLPKEES